MLPLPTPSDSTQTVPFPNQKTVKVEFIYHTLKKFYPQKDFENFEEISMGDLLGYDGTNEVRAHRNGVIIFCNPTNKPGEEAFIIGSSS